MMKSYTGQIAEIEEKSSASHGMERKTFSDENIVGGGFMSKMGKPTNNLKATVVTTDEKIVEISVPTQGFLNEGDVVSFVKEDDDMIGHYLNHTRELAWSFPIAKKDVADKVMMHSRLMNLSALVGIAAWFFSLGFPGLFGLAVLCLVAFVYSIFWALFIFNPSRKKNYKAGEALIKEEKARHSEYLARKSSERADRLKQAVSA
jgi:hypothetical protein